MDIIDKKTKRFGRLLHYCGVLAAVLCATSGYSLVHAPTIQSVMDHSARIAELQMSVKNDPIVREQHKKVSAKLQEVTTRIESVRRRVPRDSREGEFLKDLMQIASSEQVAIKDFQPGTIVTRNGYAEMHITLRGSGSYASICSFLDHLSKLTRLSKVKDLTLSAGDDEGSYPMTATLVIYFGLQGKDDHPGGRGASDSAVLRGAPNPASNAFGRRRATPGTNKVPGQEEHRG